MLSRNQMLTISLAATLNMIVAIPLKPSDLRDFRGAASGCEHGADGVIVAYNMKSRRHLQADKYGRRPSIIDILLGKRGLANADILFKLNMTNRYAAP